MKITDEDLKSNLAEFYRRKKEGAYYGIVDAPTLEAIMLDLQSARAEMLTLKSNELWAYSFNDGENWEWDESCTSREHAIKQRSRL